MVIRMPRLVCARMFGAVALMAAPTALSAQATQNDSGAYGFVRAIDGSAYVIEASSGQRTDVGANEPLLTGDLIFVSARSRVELVLADRNIARLNDRAELQLTSLAGSPDGQAEHTVLGLRRGTLQLVVVDDFIGQFYPTLETPSGTVELRAAGSYLLTVDGNGMVVTARSGAVDVITDRGSNRVEAGQELVVDAGGRRAPRYASAGPLDDLERWGDDLAAEAYGADVRYVDAGLVYAAAPLARYGSWVTIGGRRAWYPRHRSGWRPYWKGHWRHTPTGLLWVSYEPWGWVPYHYGFWDQVPGYGWVWFPGRRFAPAWVAWYWGPAYVGWAPLGFYAGYYSSGFSIRIGFGTYGWARGPGQRFRGFTFVPCQKFGHRNQHKWARRGYDLGRSGHVFKRGIITTDTRKISPPRLQRPADLVRMLDEDGRRQRGGRDLPDATPFGGRVRDLPVDGTQVALSDPGRGGRSPGRAGGVATGSPRNRAGGSSPTGAGGTGIRSGGADAGDGARGEGQRQSASSAPNRRPLVSTPGRVQPLASRPNRQQPAASGPGRSRASSDAPDRRPLVSTPNRRQPAVSTPNRRQPTARTPGRRRPGTSAPDRERAGFERPGAGSVDRPSRAGPGTERGRVKVTERAPRWSGPETRSRRSPTVSRPIAGAGRGTAPGPARSSARRSSGSGQGSSRSALGYERGARDRSVGSAGNASGRSPGYRGSSTGRVAGDSRSAGRASSLGRSSPRIGDSSPSRGSMRSGSGSRSGRGSRSGSGWRGR